jgi:hypothetical protein
MSLPEYHTAHKHFCRLPQVRKINGVEVYVAEPKEGGDKSKAILFLTDIFGLPLVNNKVSPSSWAQGYPGR